MKMKVFTIPAGDDVISESDYTFVESEWMLCIDGITKTAWEANRKTGEIRSYPYDKAIEEMSV